MELSEAHYLIERGEDAGEIELEWRIMHATKEGWPLATPEMCRHFEALRMIDEHVVAGDLEEWSAGVYLALREKWGLERLSPQQEAERDREIDDLFASKEWKAFQNFTSGLKSPDLEQRKRFQAFSEALGWGGKLEFSQGGFVEKYPFLAPLEKVKRAAVGRRKLAVPWENHNAKMHQLLRAQHQGKSVAAAARELAENDEVAQVESRAKYYSKLFAQKRSLREINST